MSYEFEMNEEKDRHYEKKEQERIIKEYWGEDGKIN